MRSTYFIKKKRLNTNEESKRRDALKTPYNYQVYIKLILHDEFAIIGFCVCKQAQSKTDSTRPLLAPAFGNSSRIAARLEEESGSVNVSWNLVAMETSGVCEAFAGRGSHFLELGSRQ